MVYKIISYKTYQTEQTDTDPIPIQRVSAHIQLPMLVSVHH